MNGDSISVRLPLSRFASEAGNDTGEATTLFQELRKPLTRYLTGLGLSAEEAQDVVQDSFLQLHKHLAAGGSQENIRGWLFRVAHNAARNFQQSYARRMGESLDPVVDAASADASPEQMVLAKEKFDRLDAAVQSLSEQERQCLMLRAEGLRYREIGEALTIPVSTVADIVSRAVSKLAEKCDV
jgi:RNA polymerase sigma-70 factor (ECF subfamily)